MSASLPPTAARLRELRRRGDVPREREAVAAAALLAGTAGLLLSAPATWRALTALAERACRGLGEVPAAGREPGAPFAGSALLSELAQEGLRVALHGAVPIVGGAALAAAAATLLQLGWPPVLRWPWRSTGTGAGLGARLGLSAVLRRAATTLLRLAAVGLLLWFAGAPRQMLTAGAAPASAPALLDALVGACRAALLAAALAFGALALAEVALARHLWWRRARMTPEQQRREIRELEGDPAIKARRNQHRRAMSRKRVASAVATASFVVVAPGEAAAALRLDAGAAAPTVVVSGTRGATAKILAAAQLHGRPLVVRSALARALCALPQGAQLPASLWPAAAEALAQARSTKESRP
ncbi:MAG: EscU/YscU/HrcU family type III secretion system export apparatus switch protein [Myxococcales bacterium]|nr:EscU/YscU/HrcU family type III secretion system export apparatus switch protein [Myxococcales bacterium]